MCHMSHVTCHRLCVPIIFSPKVNELVGGGSVINGATPSSFYTMALMYLTISEQFSLFSSMYDWGEAERAVAC